MKSKKFFLFVEQLDQFTNKHYRGDISVSSYRYYNFSNKIFDVLSEFALLISYATCSAYSAVLSHESEKMSQQKKKIFISLN